MFLYNDNNLNKNDHHHETSISTPHQRIRWVRFGAAADSTAGPSPDVAAAASWVALAWDWPIGSEKPWVFHGKMICTWLFYGVFHAFSMYNWFAVWNIWISFPYMGNNNPNWLMFFRGVWNHQPDNVSVLYDVEFDWTVTFFFTEISPEKNDNCYMIWVNSIDAANGVVTACWSRGITTDFSMVFTSENTHLAYITRPFFLVKRWIFIS